MAIRSNDAHFASEQNYRKPASTTAVPAQPGQRSNSTDPVHQSFQGNSKGWLRRWFTRAACLGGLGIMLASSTGCSMTGNMCSAFTDNHCIDDFMVNYRNQAMAEKAWHCQKQQFCNQKHSKEFKAGFIAGFIAVAEGGDGCTPSVAPQEYWGWKYQSGNGQSCVNAWFEGFPYGVRAAEQMGIGSWAQIRTAGGSYGNPGMPTHMNGMQAAPIESPFYPMDPNGVPLEAAPINLGPGAIQNPAIQSPAGPPMEIRFDQPDFGSKPVFDSSDSVSEASIGGEAGAVAESDISGVTDVAANESAEAWIAELPSEVGSSGPAVAELTDALPSESEINIDEVFGSSEQAVVDDDLPFSFE